MKIKITRYPNNETRIAAYPEKLPVDYFKAEKYLEACLDLPLSIQDSPISDCEIISDGIGSNPTLDIKLKVDTVPRRRHMALSRYGKRQVLRAGSCFSMDEGTERLLLTGTLPGSSYSAFKALAEFSTTATKTLTNWLTRRSPQCKWEYVWEFQKRHALHVHLVCEVSLKESEYIKKNFKDEWNRILRKIGSLSSVDMYQKTRTYSNDPSVTQADVTVCDREPSRYISKYISKNATNAKGFNRFPPNQWYQVSRSLLRELREKTQTFAIEGLSYGQTLSIIEQAKHQISTSAIGGWRAFSGRVFAWSGYAYENHFQITEWDARFNMKNQNLLSVRVMCLMTRAVLKKYPINRASMMAVTHSQTLSLMERDMLSETEMLLYIQTAIASVLRTFEDEFNPTDAALFLRTATGWWQAKFGYASCDPDQDSAINKICNGDLTGRTVRTKLKGDQLTLF